MLELRPVDLHLLDKMRRDQAAQMHGPVQAYDQALIDAPGAFHVGLYVDGRLHGYACYSPEDERGTRMLLEIFIEQGSRGHALPFLREALAWVPPREWQVNSYDRFGLSLAANAGYTLNRTEAFLFTFDGGEVASAALGYDFAPAHPSDIERMKPILMEDDFYTVDWRRLPVEVAEGFWHLLTSPGGTIVGVGYIEPLRRTPDYADVGLVVTADWRLKGMGSAVLGGLVRACRLQGLKAVAICAAENLASRRLLERGGFYRDGRIWSVRP